MMMCCGAYRIAGVALLLGSIFSTACSGPKYPKCETDEQCKEKGEVCVNGQCQECRDDMQCDAKYPDAPHICQSGRCEVKPECMSDADCASVGEGLVCRSDKCVPECVEDADCASGYRCEESKCVAGAECEDDAACGPGRKCVEGSCEDDAGPYTNISAACRPMNAASGEVVALNKVFFDFDQYELTVDARETLKSNVECLQQAPQVKVVLEGHCDERGTQEYNLALGEKRASTVLGYMRNMGVDTSRIATRSKGENEPVCNEESEGCWAQNRRVEFMQQLSN